MRLHPVNVEVAHSAALELTILTVERLQFVMDLTDVLPQIDWSHEGLLASVALVLLTGVVGHPVEILSHGVCPHFGLSVLILVRPRLTGDNLLEGVQQSEALVLLLLLSFNFDVEFVVLNLNIFLFDVAAINIFHLVLLITLIRSLKFDVVFNFDVIEEISTELTEVPGVLCVEEQKAVSTPEINISSIIDLTQYYSQPVDNLILHLLDEELGDGDGGEDHVRLGDSRT